MRRNLIVAIGLLVAIAGTIAGFGLGARADEGRFLTGGILDDTDGSWDGRQRIEAWIKTTASDHNYVLQIVRGNGEVVLNYDLRQSHPGLAPTQTVAGHEDRFAFTIQQGETFVVHGTFFDANGILTEELNVNVP
jgi:hypothetical protein